MKLLVGNDQTVTVTGLQDEISGDYINDATVTCTLKHRSGDEVAGGTWPITLNYVAASSGDYRGTLVDGLDLVSGRYYIIEVRAEAAGDLIGFWRQELLAAYRRLTQ